MLCSARELNLGRDHEGILELHGTFVPGQNFLDAVNLRDTRLLVDVTPNRPDLLSHWGVARELAPRGAASLQLPPFPTANGGPRSAADLRFVTGETTAAAADVRITIEDRIGCTRYYGVPIRGVTIGPSPEWLAGRLRAIGQRPINNVVDATNYVLHELGQPLHAFDLDKLGNVVVVRRARAGEKLTTLDGEPRPLNDGMLVIADAQRAVALAGVMGGLDTEVGMETRNVLLECALFDTRITRATRRAAGLMTDASQRFERGVDPDMMEKAVRRVLDLILTVAGGELPQAAPFVDAGVEPAAPIRLRTARVTQILGLSYTADRLAALLEPIEFKVLERDADALRVAVPGHRRYDVGREEDLIEEVARRHGYGEFPEDLRPFRASRVPTDVMVQLEDDLRTLLVARGFMEARSAAFAPEQPGQVALLNPLSSAEGQLRNALLPGLLRRVESNFNHGARDVRLFEIGTAFAPGGGDGLPVETTHIAAVCTGLRAPAHWTGPGQDFDRWDLKGLLVQLAGRLGLSVAPAATTDLLPAAVDAAEAWQLVAKESPAGGGGRVRSDAMDAPAWAGPVWGVEIRLDSERMARRALLFQALPVFPAVERDIALIVPDTLPAATVARTIRTAGGPLLERVDVFDVYAGKHVPAGSRSIAFRLRFQAADRTLVDQEVDAVVTRILQRLREEHNVERRA
jgi:phenylalanyl-tRNA synthetase beta chain